MTAVAPPFRFLALVIGGWVCGRTAFLLLSGSAGPVVISSAQKAVAPPPIGRAVMVSPQPGRPELVGFDPFRFRGTDLPMQSDRAPSPQSAEMTDAETSPRLRRRDEEIEGSLLPDHPIPPQLVAPGLNHDASPWSGSAWLFARSAENGSGLATGGQLGGSQVGGRIAYRAAEIGRGSVAIAARVSASLRDSQSAEAAVGIDWHPAAKFPLRLSIERRVAIGRQARDAWSAYVAGGFWRGGLAGGLEFDGYAQAGVVGARRGDLFADGALRLGMPIALDARTRLLLGGGAWGAAQPGASRLDIGPRMGLNLSVNGKVVSGSLDWRLRVAGDARPGSGPALTLAADF